MSKFALALHPKLLVRVIVQVELCVMKMLVNVIILNLSYFVRF